MTEFDTLTDYKAKLRRRARLSSLCRSVACYTDKPALGRISVLRFHIMEGKLQG